MELNAYEVRIGRNNGQAVYAKYIIVANSVEAASSVALEIEPELWAEEEEPAAVISVDHLGSVDAVQVSEETLFNPFSDGEEETVEPASASEIERMISEAEADAFGAGGIQFGSPDPNLYFDPSAIPQTEEEESVRVRTYGRLAATTDFYDQDGSIVTYYYFVYDGKLYIEDQGPIAPPLYGSNV